jgi:tripartite-type tricarboxylate transporter receptor subunit TctC
MIVPYAPGGNTDVLARLLAQRLSQTLQQQVIVDNRPGGSTLIGTEALARAPADGYTIMFTTLSFSVVPSLFKRQTYDPVKDFSPISLVANLPNVFIVNTEVPAKTMQEFIAFAKANPGKLNYASTGNGSSQHL